MPQTTSGAESTVKRKKESSMQKPSKRLRAENSEDDVQSRVLDLEKQILESKKNYNNISALIKLARSENDDEITSFAASVALCRVFIGLMAAGELTKKQKQTEKDSVVYRWLQERYAEYKASLLQLLVQSVAGSDTLTLCMRLLKNEGVNMRNGPDYSFPINFLNEILRSLLMPEVDDTIRNEFCQKYLNKYDDIRFYAISSIETILSNLPLQDRTIDLDIVIDFLEAFEPVPESDEELDTFYITAPKKKSHAIYSVSSHKKHAQAAWLAVMKVEMGKDRRKRILGLMTHSIAPWFIKPELLMDFLSDSYNAGGSTSLLALSGVFYLIQERNLDYPSFYRKLYSLLDSQLLHSKHRSKFFRLLNTFLASTHLPAVLVASFIKKLARLTLHAPPGGIVAVVPWIYNLLKRHPTCTFMIHREVRDPETKKLLEDEGMDDPFLPDEDDPMETNAIDSSLWEIVMLQSHYHPNVATLAKIISEQFTKQAYNLEDFLDHSYGSMLEAELSKEVKKVPVVEYEIPKKIFTKQDALSGVEDSLLVKLFEF